MSSSSEQELIAKLIKENQELRMQKDRLIMDASLAVPIGKAVPIVRDTDEEKRRIVQKREVRVTHQLHHDLKRVVATCSSLVAQDLKVRELQRKIDDIFTCDICARKYNEKRRVPKILTQCGHTVCKSCLFALHQQQNYQSVRCPFCQTITITAMIDLLPKNFALVAREPARTL